MSTVKKEARLSSMLLASKGKAAPAHTDHRLTVQVMDQFKAPAALREQVNEFENENSDHNNLIEVVNEINNITKRQYNEVVTSLPEFHEVKSEELVDDEFKVAKSRVAPRVKEQNIPVVQEEMAGKRIAMTLRMEQESHLKLRLHSAHSRKSCQEIISEALDKYLSEDEKVVV